MLVDVKYDTKSQEIHEWYKDEQGKLHYRRFVPELGFYVEDPNGRNITAWGEPVREIRCRGLKELRKQIAICSGKRTYETDVSPELQFISKKYYNATPPPLNIAYFDIETDFEPYKYHITHKVKIMHRETKEEQVITVKDLLSLPMVHRYLVFDAVEKEWVHAKKSRYTEPGRGFAPPEDPFMPITAITVVLDWEDIAITVAMPPKTLSLAEAKKMCYDKWGDNVILFENSKEGEAEMLKTFLMSIQDADVLSGWNSEGFDIPYTVNRVLKLLGSSYAKEFCRGGFSPKQRMFEKFGKESQTYDLYGRSHIDYLSLYRNNTFEERASYSLDSIGEHELGERKIEYEGTLDQLYNYDFETFIDYSIQDVILISKLDEKLKFMDLLNGLARKTGVRLPDAMGSVKKSDQAILNEAKYIRGLIMRDKVRSRESVQAAGAYVATPVKGLHKWVGSMDLNSLYPSIIRAMNMSPETIVGQIRQDKTEEMIAEGMRLKKKSFAECWEGRFACIEYDLVMDRRKDELLTIDWEDGRVDHLSADEVYKLVFETDNPLTLSANGTLFTTEREGIIPGVLTRWYAERVEMKAKAKQASKDGDEKLSEHWDRQQLLTKLLLNSVYGILLNPGSRFFDPRLGQSITLTGRSIVKHMSAQVNKVITGDYDHAGLAVVYGDTDSVYFSAFPIFEKEINKGDIPWDKDSVIKLYDHICEEANSSFEDFMYEAFHCPASRAGVIAAGREIVAQTGLYIAKKRYAALVIDDEGKRTDVDGESGKIKAMGLDLRRSDTPAYMQDFLREILLMVLEEKDKASILDRIKEFRDEFRAMNPWEKGSPKRANNITSYREKEAAQGKTNMPGHIRASINWNTLKKLNNDTYSQDIVDGMKIIVCKLKPNPTGFTSVARPTDQHVLPDWFKELPFDDDTMEAAVVDKKIENLIGVLDFDLSSTKDSGTFDSMFSFGD